MSKHECPLDRKKANMKSQVISAVQSDTSLKPAAVKNLLARLEQDEDLVAELAKKYNIQAQSTEDDDLDLAPSIESQVKEFLRAYTTKQTASGKDLLVPTAVSAVYVLKANLGEGATDEQRLAAQKLVNSAYSTMRNALSNTMTVTRNAVAFRRAPPVDLETGEAQGSFGSMYSLSNIKQIAVSRTTMQEWVNKNLIVPIDAIHEKILKDFLSGENKDLMAVAIERPNKQVGNQLAQSSIQLCIYQRLTQAELQVVKATAIL